METGKVKQMGREGNGGILFEILLSNDLASYDNECDLPQWWDPQKSVDDAEISDRPN